uniref:Tudor domain-containing 10 n=1 Tax=Xenopus tropicalis TaxID=8364 RepID=A0A6I8QIH7_XENTR
MDAPKHLETNKGIYVGNLPHDTTEEEIHALFKEFQPISIKKHQRDIKCFAFVGFPSPKQTQQAIDKVQRTVFKGRSLLLKPIVPQDEGWKTEGRKTEAPNKQQNPGKGCTCATSRRILPSFAYVTFPCPKDTQRALTRGPRIMYKGRTLFLKPNWAQAAESRSNAENSDRYRTADPKDMGEIYIGNLPCDIKEKELQELLSEYEPESIRMVQKDIKCFAFVNLSSEEKIRSAANKIHGAVLKGRRLLCKINTIPGGGSTTKPGAGSKAPVDLPELEEVADTDESTVANQISANGTMEELAPAAAPERQVRVSNLPEGATEKILLCLFEPFNPVRLWKEQLGDSWAAVVELGSPDEVPQAVEQLRGTTLNGRQLRIEAEQKEAESLFSSMPELEPVPPHELNGCINGHPPEVPNNQRPPYAMPVEMRCMLLSHMLRDCFHDLSWLAAIMNVSGEADLLVTNVAPQTPYFWAVLLTKDLAKVESQLPFLAKEEVQRGRRCLAQIPPINGEEAKWNRCWVYDVIFDLAVVFMLDYGLAANVPVRSLRRLDDARFWVTPPLAQPFVLQEGHASPDLIKTIVRGRITGFCSSERQVLMFSRCTNEE